MPERLTYTQLLTKVNKLAEQATRDSQGISKIGNSIAEEAHGTARVAQMIGSLNVDPSTVAETQELASYMDALAESAHQQCTLAEGTARRASGAADTARTLHGGINEAISRSPASNIHDVNRQWLTRE